MYIVFSFRNSEREEKESEEENQFYNRENLEDHIFQRKNTSGKR